MRIEKLRQGPVSGLVTGFRELRETILDLVNDISQNVRRKLESIVTRQYKPAPAAACAANLPGDPRAIT